MCTVEFYNLYYILSQPVFDRTSGRNRSGNHSGDAWRGVGRVIAVFNHFTYEKLAGLAGIEREERI